MNNDEKYIYQIRENLRIGWKNLTRDEFYELHHKNKDNFLVEFRILNSKHYEETKHRLMC
jgi:hypothetical protein